MTENRKKGACRFRAEIADRAKARAEKYEKAIALLRGMENRI